MEIRSITEIKLLRRNLKKELRYSEQRITNDVYAIIGGYKAWITYNVIEKGVNYSLNFILKKLFPKRF